MPHEFLAEKEGERTVLLGQSQGSDAPSLTCLDATPVGYWTAVFPCDHVMGRPACGEKGGTCHGHGETDTSTWTAAEPI